MDEINRKMIDESAEEIKKFISGGMLFGEPIDMNDINSMLVAVYYATCSEIKPIIDRCDKKYKDLKTKYEDVNKLLDEYIPKYEEIKRRVDEEIERSKEWKKD
jgi:hypothetical protein